MAGRPVSAGDIGIYPDLDDQVTVELPGDLDTEAVTLELVVDARHRVTVLYDGIRPVKAWADDDDRTEIARLEKEGVTVRKLGAKAAVVPGDRDDDGIPDPLDILIGGKKLVANGADYTGDYFTIEYPNGDAPRDKGSCADVVIRSLRNAGLDLQEAMQRDIRKSPKSYPMVKKRDSNIDHRRVRTMLPWFKRHFEARGIDPLAKDDPFLPGDIVFMDTIPSRAGTDHVGIVSDKKNSDGLPLIINNWTNGYQDAEMDLLPFVPVTHRFRMK